MAIIGHWPLKKDLYATSKASFTHMEYVKGTDNAVIYYKTIHSRTGVNFNNTQSYLLLTAQRDFVPRTISFWYFHEGNDRIKFLFSDSTEEEVYELHTNLDGGLRFLLTKKTNQGAVSANLIFDLGSGCLTNAHWNHITVVTANTQFIGSEVTTVYINGRYVDRQGFPISADMVPYSKRQIVFGNRKTNDTSYNLSGILSDIRVYNHPIAESMVSELYTADPEKEIDEDVVCEYYFDKSLTTQIGCTKPFIPNNVSFEEDDEMGHFLSVNKTGDALCREVPNFFKWDDVWISFWVKLPKHGGASTRENLLSFTPHSPGGFHFLFGEDNIHFAAWNSSTCLGPPFYSESSPSALGKNLRDRLTKWSYVRCRINNSSLYQEIYIDDEFIGRESYTNPDWSNGGHTIEMVIGGMAASDGGTPDRKYYIKYLRIGTTKPTYEDALAKKNFRFKSEDKPILHIPMKGTLDTPESSYGFMVYPGSAIPSQSLDSVLGKSLKGSFSTDTKIEPFKYLCSLMEREFSINFWYKELKDKTVGKHNAVFGVSPWGSIATEYGINIGRVDDVMFFKIHFKGAVRKLDAKIPIEEIPNLKEWNMYTMTFSGSSVKLYLNGILKYVHRLGRLERLGWKDIDMLKLGNWKVPAENIGEPDAYLLNDFRIYNRVLYQDEIHNLTLCNLLDFEADKNSEFQRNLIGYYNYDRGAHKGLEDLGSKHPGALIPMSGWSDGYNAGVPDPSIGYHAYWRRMDGKMTMVFNSKNSEVGHPGRWMGISTSLPGFSLKPGDKVTISWDQYESINIGHMIRVGIHHKVTTESGWNFYSGIVNKTNTELNKWTRQSVTLTMVDNFKVDDGASLYVYGHYGAEGIAYVRNVMVELSDHPTEYSDEILCPNIQNLTNMTLSKCVWNNSGFNGGRGIVHKRLDGTVYVRDDNKNSRPAFDLPFKFTPNVKYSVSVDLYDLTWATEEDKVTNTIGFQIQFYRGPEQATNNVIWTTPGKAGQSGSRGTVQSIIDLGNGWKRVICNFIFIPPLSTSNPANSKIFIQAGEDYTGYTRSYLMKNLKICQGNGDPNFARYTLVDKSIHNNGGYTISDEKIVDGNKLVIDTKNYTKMQRVLFNNLCPTTDFTYCMNFKAYRKTNSAWHFLGFSYGSQIDGLTIDESGYIWFRRYRYNSKVEMGQNFNYKIDFDKWYNVMVNYSAKTKVIKLYVNGVHVSSIVDAILEPFSISSDMDSIFGINAHLNINNYPSRAFHGEVKNVAYFGRCLEWNDVSKFLYNKVIMKGSGEIETNLPTTMSKKYVGSNVGLYRLTAGSDSRDMYIGNLFIFRPSEYFFEPETTFRLDLSLSTYFGLLMNYGNDVMVDVELESVGPLGWSSIMITDINDGGNFKTKVSKNYCTVSFKLSDIKTLVGTHLFIDMKFIKNMKSPFIFRVNEIRMNGAKSTGLHMFAEKINKFRDTNMLNYKYMEPLRNYQSANFLIQDSEVTRNIALIDVNQNGNLDVLMGNTFADGNYEGGYDSRQDILVRTTNIYRFSILARRTTLAQGNHYFGTNGPHLIDSNGATSNLYFGHPQIETMTACGVNNDWHLFVFYILKSSDGLTYRNDHGMYKLDITGDLVPLPQHIVDGVFGTYNGNGNMKFTVGDVFTRMQSRAYLYYAAADARCQFYRPRVDVCDGTEPSIAELVLGLDHDTFPIKQDMFRINPKTIIDKCGNIKTNIVRNKIK